VSRPLARVLAVWRTGLSGPVIVLQAGTAVNFFGTGLILPFEIIYLHEVRGFPTATAGLVLAAVMGTAAVVTLPSGALLDRFRAKPILITGNLVNALGYGGLAFVDRPWQGFVCSVVGGAGFGVAGTANQVLSLTLVTPEQRAASIALRRVAGNFGMGAGATVAGFIVASANHLRTFQALYLFDAVTFAVFALVVLVGIPNPRLANAASASDSGRGFRAVAQDRLLLALIAANIVLVMVGGAFFSNVLPPFATAHTPVGPGEIGVVIFLNTFFIVVAQVPATRVVKRMRRTHALAATSALFAVGLLAVLLATLTRSTPAATTVLAGVAIVIAIGECAQFIVLGPVVAELAPPHLLGRYMSLYGLSFTVGVALGPAVGGALLATSPDAVWWGGALALAVTGAGFLRLGHRIPDARSLAVRPGSARRATNPSRQLMPTNSSAPQEMRTPICGPCSSTRRVADRRIQLREHPIAREDLPQTFHRLPAADNRQCALCGRRGSRDPSGGDVCPGLLVGRQGDGGILRRPVMNLDRAVVDREVEG
jgi:MFS family permease